VNKRRIPTDGAQPELRQGLPGLAALRERLPAADAAAAPPAPFAPDAQPAPAAPSVPAAKSTVYTRGARVVVRRERKGHGGKTMTRIEGLVGTTRELESAVRDVKRALGCGAALERGDVLVQGDQGERLQAFLASHGVRKIVVGS